MLRVCPISLAAMAVACSVASAQQRQPAPLRLGGVTPGGVSVAATESWQSFDFNITNTTDDDRLARVCMMYAARPDVQYGRDIWVPARSSMAAWMIVGPAQTKPGETLGEIQSLLYDRTDGTDRLLLPASEEKIRSRAVLYRKREPFTAILLDEEGPEEWIDGQLPQPPTPADEAMELVRTFRLARNLSEHINNITARSLPATLQAFDSIDHFVVASNRIARDPAGMQALRHWIEQGGHAWVMLDMVEPDAVAPLLGDSLDFQVVDRVGLTTTQVKSAATPLDRSPVQQHERPVPLVRVLLPRDEQAEQTVQGWPARFSRVVGRGKVIFTTLGGRAWHRPRTSTEERAKYRSYPNLPEPTMPLIELAENVHPPQEQAAFNLDKLQPLLADEIGYRVPSRVTMALTCAGFLSAALALAVVLRRTRRPELLGWLGPAAALGTTGVFFALAESSRRATPPTIAVAQLVDAVAGQDEAAAHGLLAVYQPSSGPATFGANQDGYFDLDMQGIEGQTRRMIGTDVLRWHWENINLPAGIRLAPFRAALTTPAPIRAVARFGPDGVEGRLAAAPFQDLSDALISTANGRTMALRLRPDGTFRCGSDDVLPIKQFLAGAVLTDAQQRRQEVYRALLTRKGLSSLEESTVVMAWAQSAPMEFTLASDARIAGNALLKMPLQWERPPSGGRVMIPGPLVTYYRTINGVPARPTFEAGQQVDMKLRFQLPAEVLPLRVDRARVVGKIEAPNRKVRITASGDGKPEVIYEAASPLDVIRQDITAERHLRLDAGGGLHLDLAISEPIRNDGKSASERWKIEFLELEVSGICP